MPHPERSGCGNTVCRLHRRQAELYGHYLGDKESLAEIVDAGRKTKIAKVAKLQVAFWVDGTKNDKDFLLSYPIKKKPDLYGYNHRNAIFELLVHGLVMPDFHPAPSPNAPANDSQ